MGTKVNLQSGGVDVWSYHDSYLQAEQFEQLKRSSNISYQAVIHLVKNQHYNSEKYKIINLEQEGDFIKWSPDLNDDYLLTRTNTNYWEGYRLPAQRPDVYIVSTKDGSRKCIKKQSSSFHNFSPDGKYVYWYDENIGAYFTYDIKSGIIRNISRKVPEKLYSELNEWPNPRGVQYGYATWLKDDKAILVYDRYDIWQLDAEGIKSPINITNGYGRKNQIILRFVNKYGSGIEKPIVNAEEDLLICGLAEKNKRNGFFKKKLGRAGDPFKQVMEQGVYYFPDVRFVSLSTYLIKAKDAEVYLLKYMSATEYPNLHLTKDFKTFTSLTTLAPQGKYNWLTSELLHWKTFNGHLGEGILYKPENFDSTKQYPVIFYFYEQLTAGLNKFIMPELSKGLLDIPTYVSNGYIVFCPDIHYTVGNPGPSAYDYVVSAAKMIGQQPWADEKRMGIQGHSWGGYEVNYLITCTGIFVAAASAAGPTEFISASGIPKSDGRDSHPSIEYGQNRMGSSIWDDIPAYIKNSPLFGADKVSTPLLMMHNKLDVAVDWFQGLRFFTGLRRLGKKVWLLQYDNEGHTLDDEKDQLDYTIRMTQFFDHYLKGVPPPKWMLNGIPAKMKGIDDGFALDSTGRTP